MTVLLLAVLLLHLLPLFTTSPQPHMPLQLPQLPVDKPPQHNTTTRLLKTTSSVSLTAQRSPMW